MTGLTGNATAKTEGELQYYENDQLIGERYRLDVRSLLSSITPRTSHLTHISPIFVLN